MEVSVKTKIIKLSLFSILSSENHVYFAVFEGHDTHFFISRETVGRTKTDIIKKLCLAKPLKKRCHRIFQFLTSYGPCGKSLKIKRDFLAFLAKLLEK